ncbi:MAG: hypothetical protein L0206_02080 [Actinobacteria bacterium]|nr:hypothetical protein [Actinomycetota bacterium]
MTRARLGALLLLGVAAFGWNTASAQSGGGEEHSGILTVDVPGVSFEELLSIPEVVALARSGGAGLMANAENMVVPPPGERTGIPGQPPGEIDVRFDPNTLGLEEVGRLIRDAVESNQNEELLVIVFSSRPSKDMLAAKDDLRGIVLAQGSPDALLGSAGPEGSLTSDSTRRDGVVNGADFQATISASGGGVPLASDPPPTGAPIEVIQGPPPYELHERYLAQRRMYIPVGAAAAAYLIGFGLVAIALLAAGERVGFRWRRVAGWISLSVAMLAVGLLAAGHLPELTYATVVPFVALVTAFGTLAFAPLERRDVLLVPAGIGLAVLGFFVVEAALGWSAMLTPFVGGAQLDGGRFYGMPNVGIGLLVGACFWVAQRLRTGAGVWLLVGAALFAGLPFLGANLGGAATLFAGAGLWVAVRERERLGTWKGLAVFLGFTLVGTALILLVHAISPVETHVTRFEEQVSGLGGVLREFTDRLQVGFDLSARNPLALIPVLGLPVAILAVLRPPSALRPSLERSPAWRDAILATLLTGVVAYVLNDSGPAAAGFAFGLGLGGLLGVSLLLGAGKIVDR